MTGEAAPRGGPDGDAGGVAAVGWIVLGSLAWLGGTALQLRQPALWPAAVQAALFAAVLLAVGLAWWARGAWRTLGLVVALALAAFALSATRAQWRLAEALPPALEGRDLLLTGVVAQMPRRGPDGVRFVFAVEQAALDGAAVPVPARVSLGWYRSGAGDDEGLATPQAPFDGLAAGQRWRFVARLGAPHGSLNPHGFDQELWLFEQGIRAVGSVRASAATPAERLALDAGAPVERARQWVRDAIERRVPDARAAGVLAALAVGDQAAIERSDWDLFRATGIAHLVAISGLHVTMFAWLAALAIGRLWRLGPRAMHWLPAVTAARWGGLVAAAGYALLAGWGVPAQRTVWMLAAAALLMQLGARWPWPMVLLVVAAVVAAIDPWALLQPGFWLSFVAVGLLLASEPASRDAAPPAAGRVAALWRAMRHGVRTQVIATLGLSPLTLVFFQQVSVVGFIANLVAIPLVTLLVTPLALLGVLLPPLWSLAAALVQGLTALLGGLAAWPWAVWTAAAAPWWVQAAALAGAALLVMPLPWALRALAIPLVLPLFAPTVARPAEGAMQVVVADVGQGSAVLVRTRSHALLHDTGAQYSRDSDAGTRVLLPLLRALGVTRLDRLMLSHRDSDHVGGAPALLAALEVKALSSSLEPGHALLAGPRPQQRCEAGQAWVWDGVQFRVLHPRAEDYARANAKPNTLSCVLSVTDAQGRRLLLTGDLEAEQEARLVRDDAAALRSDVLLVPHHGSKTSSTPAFVEAVAPRVALVQAGYRNRFGHPAPEVLQRYAARGVTVLTTSACGAWVAASDGLATCERRRARRYWHHGLEVAPKRGESNPGETAPWPSMSR
jgi:competence protein ComEC